jgi:tRNA (guanosine-2'-O-)-methyltransferase
MIPERFARLKAVLDRRQPDLTVLMDRVHKPHNLSAILRNCDAAGVLEAHAVPVEAGLELSREASGGTAKWIRVHRHPDARTALTFLKASGFRVVAAHPTEGATPYREIDYTRPTAILVGAELHGVSEVGIELADELAAIPMLGMVRSLNVSVAAAILLMEALHQRVREGMYEESRLPPERHRKILFEWAYPKLARRCRARGERYPELSEEGEIIGELSR